MTSQIDRKKLIQAITDTHAALNAINPKWAIEAGAHHQRMLEAARKS